MAVKIRKIPPEETRPLRQELLRQGVPLDKLIYSGDLEPDTLHIGAFIGGEQVGIATAMCQPPNLSHGVPPSHPDPANPAAWRLRGMAISEEVRGAGVGTKMLKACVGHVADKNGAFIWCDARVAARSFYQKNGFVVVGAQYNVPGVGPHFFMQRNVSAGDVALLDLYLA